MGVAYFLLRFSVRCDLNETNVNGSRQLANENYLCSTTGRSNQNDCWISKARERQSLVIVVQCVSYGQFHSFLARLVRLGLRRFLVGFGALPEHDRPSNVLGVLQVDFVVIAKMPVEIDGTRAITWNIFDELGELLQLISRAIAMVTVRTSRIGTRAFVGHDVDVLGEVDRIGIGRSIRQGRRRRRRWLLIRSEKEFVDQRRRSIGANGSYESKC